MKNKIYWYAQHLLLYSSPYHKPLYRTLLCKNRLLRQIQVKTLRFKYFKLLGPFCHIFWHMVFIGWVIHSVLLLAAYCPRRVTCAFLICLKCLEHWMVSSSLKAMSLSSNSTSSSWHCTSGEEPWYESLCVHHGHLRDRARGAGERGGMTKGGKVWGRTETGQQELKWIW